MIPSKKKRYKIHLSQIFFKPNKKWHAYKLNLLTGKFLQNELAIET